MKDLAAERKLDERMNKDREVGERALLDVVAKMPQPDRRSSASSNGDRSRSVKPAECIAGQKRFPGRAKWCPTAAE